MAESLDSLKERVRALRSDFEAALREARVDDALALRRGELLAGFDDDANEAWSGWLRLERDRLRAAWRDRAIALNAKAWQRFG